MWQDVGVVGGMMLVREDGGGGRQERKRQQRGLGPAEKVEWGMDGSGVLFDRMFYFCKGLSGGINDRSAFFHFFICPFDCCGLRDFFFLIPCYFRKNEEVYVNKWGQSVITNHKTQWRVQILFSFGYIHVDRTGLCFSPQCEWGDVHLFVCFISSCCPCTCSACGAMLPCPTGT